MSFYGDETRWFIGTVKNYDPSLQGALQIRIFGIHGPDISDENLPYAETMLPSTEGGVSGIGKIPQILKSALVFGIFLDGKDSQQPLILGSLSKKEFPSIAQYQRAPTETKDVYNPDNLNADATFISPDLKTAYYEGNPSINQKRLIIMQFLISNKFSPEMAAGVVGNLEQLNSQFDPIKINEGEESAGIGKWKSTESSGRRLQKLKLYAGSNRQVWDDFFVQLSYIIHELRGQSNPDTNGGSYNSTYNKLLLCDNYEGGKDEFNATWVFLNEYQNVENKEAELDVREEKARKAFSQWKSSIENYAGPK